MKCKCLKDNALLIRWGKINNVQRYKCKSCKVSFLGSYKYRAYDKSTNNFIVSPFGYKLRGQSTNGIYRFGYQGNFSEFDEETKLNSFLLRQYDAVIGRWTSTDPKNQYFSPYVGMGNNPVSRTDPDGGKDIIDITDAKNKNITITTNDENFDRIVSNGVEIGQSPKGHQGSWDGYNVTYIDGRSWFAKASSESYWENSGNFTFNFIPKDDQFKWKNNDGSWGLGAKTFAGTIAVVSATVAGTAVVAGEAGAYASAGIDAVEGLAWDNLVTLQNTARVYAPQLGRYVNVDKSVKIVRKYGSTVYKFGKEIYKSAAPYGKTAYKQFTNFMF
jgi:RHS repeat-associated protein